MANQGSNGRVNREDDATPGVAVEPEKGEIGIRLATAVKLAGGNRAVSAKSGIPLRTLARLLAGQEPKVEHLIRVASACGVSLDWLATGKGAPTTEPADPSAIAARQEAINEALKNENAPIVAERMRERPELADIHRELMEMAHRPDLSDAQRAFADMVLRLAFDDASASQRHAVREERLFNRLRASGTVFRKAVEVVGWEPPAAFGQAIRSLIFSYEISLEDAISVLDALRYDCEKETN